MFLMLRAKALTWRSQNRLNCKDRLKNGRDTQTIAVKVAVVRVARHRNRKSQFFSYQRAVFCKRRPWCSPLDYTKKILHSMNAFGWRKKWSFSNREEIGNSDFFFIRRFLLGNNRVSRTILGLTDGQSASQQFDGSLNKIGPSVNPGSTARGQVPKVSRRISGLSCFIKKGH